MKNVASTISRKIKLVILFVFIFSLSYSQIILSGKVIDAASKAALPYANLYLVKKQYSSACNDAGIFMLNASIPDTLLVMMVGYETTKLPFFESQEHLVIRLQKTTTKLEKIVIKKSKKKKKDLVAENIIDLAIANKRKNDYQKLPDYECKVYNRLQININNIDSTYADKTALKPLGFIFKSIDSTSFDKPSVPVLMSETFSRIFIQKNPSRSKEIIDANKISGVDNSSISQFSGNLSMDYNIYEDYINAFQKDFLSPLAYASGLSYKYFMIDSSLVEGRKVYQIYCTPRRPQELTFRGTLWIDGTSYAIMRFDLEMAKDANVNLVQQLSFQREYAIYDSVWIPSSERIFIEMNLQKNQLGFYGVKKTVFTNYQFNQKHPQDFFSVNQTLFLSDSIEVKHDERFWNKVRPDTLSTREVGIYKNIDSVMNTKYAKRIKAVARMFASGYYPFEKFEYGPYFTTYSYNNIEGNRLRIGGSTKKALHKKMRWQGYIAYGTKDKKMKYSSTLTYYFKMVPRMFAAIDVSSDLRILNASADAFQPDNILSSITRRVMPQYLNVERYSAYFEKEWVKGTNNRITFSKTTISPIGILTFKNADNTFLNSIPISTIELSGRFARKEKLIEDGFHRISMKTKSPIITYSFEAGLKGTFGSTYAYQKAKIKFVDRWYMGPLGYMQIVSEIGKTWGTLPYALLTIHYGNNSYYFDSEAFNLMNPFEFVSDQYAYLMATHHFNGALFNKLPLFRKLQWRELIFARGVYGSLSNANQNATVLPAGMSRLKEPYLEVGFGVENIFKLMRVDALWRLTNLDNPATPRFGINVGFSIEF